MFGALGVTDDKRSAEPEVEDEALFPCLLKRRSDDPSIEAVVDILKVE